MQYGKNDYAGTGVFAFKEKSGGTRFFPYALETINEYIKAKYEMDLEREIKSGAI